MKTATFTAMLLALAGAAHADQFKLTITNFGGQPLSPLFYAASTSGFDEFTLGGAASAGIKNIAERGDATMMLAIAGASADVGTSGLVGASPLGTGLSRTLTFEADAAHPYFSFAAMLGKTNDGFIGESVSSRALKLFGAGGAESFSFDVFGDRAWDAGTELNTQDAADLAFLGGTGNPAEASGDAVVRQHAGVIPNVGDSWAQMPSWALNERLATVSVQAVPEPGSLAALGLGAAAMLRRRRRAR